MHNSFSFALIAAAFLALAACGGGGGSTGGVAAPAQFATVGIALTDAPTGEVDQALATITSIELLGEDGKVVLFSGVETIDAKLVGNGKIDLNPRGPFFVAAVATLVITLDFDVKKSLEVPETGNGRVIVRPVIFVDIANGLPAPGLTRIHGEIAAINDSGELRLCQSALISSSDEDRRHEEDGRCVLVTTDAATCIFGVDGLPREYFQLAVGDEATIIGRLRPRDHEEDDADEDSRKSRDEDGDDDSDNDNDGDSDEDEGADHDGDRFVVDAYIIEQGPLGTFKRLAGVITTPVNPVTDRFGTEGIGGCLVASTILARD